MLSTVNTYLADSKNFVRYLPYHGKYAPQNVQKLIDLKIIVTVDCGEYGLYIEETDSRVTKRFRTVWVYKQK